MLHCIPFHMDLPFHWKYQTHRSRLRQNELLELIGKSHRKWLWGLLRQRLIVSLPIKKTRKQANSLQTMLPIAQDGITQLMCTYRKHCGGGNSKFQCYGWNCITAQSVKSWWNMCSASAGCCKSIGKHFAAAERAGALAGSPEPPHTRW